MKINRSSTCTLKFATQSKHNRLGIILQGYSDWVNAYIQLFWTYPKELETRDLTKDVLDSVAIAGSPYSARLRQTAARQALGMVKATKSLGGNCPTHTHTSGMQLSSTCARLEPATEAKAFDAWLVLHSLGLGRNFKLPIKFHRQFNKLLTQPNSKRLESYLIFEDRVQFCFEIKTDVKKDSGKMVGIDTGMINLAATSGGDVFGTELMELVAKVNRCKHGSKHQKRLRKTLRYYIDRVVKELPWDELRLIVVEKLRNITRGTRKAKRWLAKNIRRVLGSWNYRYWLMRLQQATELNRVSFRTVSPYRTSIMCANCGHVEKGNRITRDKFLCCVCGHQDDADINAAKNILQRFLTGPYGAGFQI